MSMEFSPADKDALLLTARKAIESGLQERQPQWPTYGPVAEEHYGAFVTLHKTSIQGQRLLRGCIGRLSSSLPLRITIRDMALAAAFEDHRFPSLAEAELITIDIEISVLSPFESCSPEGVVPGEHGVYLTRGNHSGVFLPQVASEQGWDRHELLEQLCAKAGLEGGAYRTSGAKLFRFTATIFGEQGRPHS